MTFQGSLRFPLRMALGAGAVVLVAVVALIDRSQRLDLLHPELVTGWVLLAAVVFLALLNVRKKLSMVPVGRASDWVAAHVVLGVVVIVIYAFHARAIWPSGYELALALLFYAVILSGLIGYLLQRMAPASLANLGYEVIWERIPAELADMRERIEASILECARETGSEVLPRLYREELAWYFRRPRFVLASLVGTGASSSWVHHRLDSVSIYLRGKEIEHATFLRECARRKVHIDRAYAIQGLLKCWLLVHVPATYGFLVLVLWHLILVHVYLV
jgi:hypothetical protein